MKALFMVPCRSGFTGASMAALNIAMGLASLGVEVHVVTSKPPQSHLSWLKRLREKGVRVKEAYSFKSSKLYWLSLTLSSMREMVSKRVFIIHPHTPKVCAMIGPPAKMIGRRLILTLEGDPIEELREAKLASRILGLLAWRVSLKIVDAICPCSKWLAKVVVKREGGLKAKVIPAHNPIDFERFEKANGEGVKEELGVKGLMIFTPARLDKVKGIDVLIEAAKMVIDEGEDVYFVVAGEGPLKLKLEEDVEKLGLKGHVKLVGFRGDVERLMAACDILTLPSIYEPFGMPAAEAGACRKPAITSRSGGLKEVIRDGVTGLLVEPGSPKELSKAILKLVRDEGARRRMGLLNYENVKASFTTTIIANKILSVYSRVNEG